MSGAGKMGDRGGGRESTKSLNKSKQTKHAIEVHKTKSREQYLLSRPKYSPSAPPIVMPEDAAATPPMIDASCHLLSRSFNRDLIAVMRRAKESGIVGCVLHCDWTRVTELMSLVKQWPGVMFATLGISPDIIKKTNDKVFETKMEQLLDLALQPEVVALELGLDFTRDLGTHFLQGKLFSAQISLARQVRLPLIVWEKAAAEQVCEQLQAAREAMASEVAIAPFVSQPAKGAPSTVISTASAADRSFFPRVAIHNFNGTATDLERFLKFDCYIMVNGVVCDVKFVGEAGAAAASSSSASAAPSKAEQDAAKAKREAEGAGEDEEADEVEEADEPSDGTGFKAQALVGPSDLTGSGAHLFHLLRQGLLPLNRLLVSTDAPLHTPQSITDFYIRTSRNEPSNMPHIFTTLARAYNLPVSQIAATVFATSKEFFGLLNVAEAAAEEEKYAEKERAKQAEEKKILDRHARSEAEERKRKDREAEAAAEAAAAATGGKQKKKDKTAAVAEPAAPTSTAADSDSDDGGKKKKKGGGGGGGKQQPPAKGGKKAAAPAAADSDDSDGGWGKQKTKTQQKKVQQKQKQKQKKGGAANKDDDSDEESEEEVAKPAPSKAAKGKAAAAPAAAKKKAAESSSSESSSSSSSESEDEEAAAKRKAKAKKVAAAAAAAKKSKKESSSESSSSSSSSEDEAPKPKASKKQVPAAAATKKAASAAAASSSDSDDSDAGATKRSAETIAADRRARAAAIKATQEATKDARKRGEVKVKAKSKAAAAAAGVGDADEVDELNEMFMAQEIDGLEAARKEAARELEQQKKASAAAAAASGSSHAADDEEQEVVHFRCRKCQQKLFTNADEIGHSDAAATAAAISDISACEQLFIRQPEWVSEDTLEAAAAVASAGTGSGAVDLCCFKCNAKVGRVSVGAPLVCACGRSGAGGSPYCSVKLSRIDALTLSATSVRGPRAIDSAELDKKKEDEALNAERLRQREKEKANEKRKAKNASKMPVVASYGNFTQFRNKSVSAHRDPPPKTVSNAQKKRLGEQQADVDEEEQDD